MRKRRIKGGWRWWQCTTFTFFLGRLQNCKMVIFFADINFILWVHCPHKAHNAQSVMLLGLHARLAHEAERSSFRVWILWKTLFVFLSGATPSLLPSLPSLTFLSFSNLWHNWIVRPCDDTGDRQTSERRDEFYECQWEWCRCWSCHRRGAKSGDADINKGKMINELIITARWRHF